ncbi:ribonuclease T1 [Actinoalloteichus hoggarensis]|uniref:Guanyl-specific ribonuclease St n=1 Tax=Actinoalloteichus hoggarensis TaxID=1470176 RepID=A0A221W8I2_9PSEU|nr:ribonuclease domain-containing protein [Actinoalloteichus hoggarensis]ASO22312.1 Guanyl-specific ribonuclease St [Actinoalloteichus hoggarensis]MBB5923268.1 ribonuclease T1 [Actinoalloteichus hoggarensis]
MTTITRRAVAALLFALLAFLPFGGTGLAAAPSTGSLISVVQQPDCGDTTGFTQVDLASLPPETAETATLIQEGGPFPHPQDGTVFGNRERLLPDCENGYYHEYTVETPGVPHRGARRLVTGDDDEYFYTDDHYASFVLVDVPS